MTCCGDKRGFGKDSEHRGTFKESEKFIFIVEEIKCFWWFVVFVFLCCNGLGLGFFFGLFICSFPSKSPTDIL